MATAVTETPGQARDDGAVSDAALPAPVPDAERTRALWDHQDDAPLLTPRDYIVVAAAVAGSAALTAWAVDDWRWVAGFLAAALVIVVAAWLVLRARPVVKAETVIAPDWTVARVAAEGDGGAVAITDAVGRLVCANDRYTAWFSDSAMPQDIAFADAGMASVHDAVRKAWQSGSAEVANLARGTMRCDLTLTVAGRSDQYLVWRFTERTAGDLEADVRRAMSGPLGDAMGYGGIMTTLVAPDGTVLVANEAFALRAHGEAPMPLAGRALEDLFRLDEEKGAIYFAAEGARATPVRVLQVPLGDPPENSAMLFLLIDDDGGGTERGVAQSYIEALLSTLPFGLALADRDGRMQFVNHAFVRAAGIEGQQTPRYPGDIVVKEDKGPLADMVRRYSSGQQTAGVISIRLAAAPDETVPLRVAGVRGLGDASVLLTLKDSSEEAQLKRQVAQATKMQAVGQLAGGIAHDFNNILTAIIGACDLMLMRHTPGDSDYDDIQQVQSNANRAASLTRQLLAFSRQQTLRPTVLQLADVVAEVTHLLNRLIGDSVEIVTRHGRGVPSIRADRGQLEQVLVNLAVNARDAMPDGGRLLIETFSLAAPEVRRLGAAVMPITNYAGLRIIDEGVGIPPDVMQKIFEPFFTTKDVGRGTGLGLSTVYGIVKQSDGFIFADSEPGRGTTFSIFFPAYAGTAEELAAAAEPAPAPAAVATRWETGTILLVEDEDMVRAVAERSLVRAGYTVITAANGEEGLERFAASDSIDLILSDVMMPLLDGPAMMRRIRETSPSVPCIFMSGYAEEQLRKNIDIEGISFLAKPFSVAQLTELVGRTIAPQPES